MHRSVMAPPPRISRGHPPRPTPLSTAEPACAALTPPPREARERREQALAAQRKQEQQEALKEAVARREEQEQEWVAFVDTALAGTPEHGGDTEASCTATATPESTETDILYLGPRFSIKVWWLGPACPVFVVVAVNPFLAAWDGIDVNAAGMLSRRCHPADDVNGQEASTLRNTRSWGSSSSTSGGRSGGALWRWPR
eukprot:COSAG01_NODE_2256_length_8067_cov_5.797691_9_plen_198_part_00